MCYSDFQSTCSLSVRCCTQFWNALFLLCLLCIWAAPWNNRIPLCKSIRKVPSRISLCTKNGAPPSVLMVLSFQEGMSLTKLHWKWKVAIWFSLCGGWSLTALYADVNIPLFSIEWPNYDFSVLFFLCPPVYTGGHIVFALFVGLFVALHKL